MSKYIDVLLNNKLDQSKTKLVINNNSAKVYVNNQILGNISITNKKASFQYEIN